jgi:hypothetical protein
MDPGGNAVGVYSCVFGEEDKSLYRQRRNRELFNQAGRGGFEKESMPSKQLMEEICSATLENVTFTIYSKTGEDQQYDYEAQILIDTHFFGQVEQFSRSNGDDNERYAEAQSIIADMDEISYIKYIDGRYSEELKELRELLYPLRRAITEEEDYTVNRHTNYPICSLRHRVLLIPIKLRDSWTILWVRFTKHLKLVEIYQFGTDQFMDDKITYTTKALIKILVMYILGLNIGNDKSEELVYIFTYIANQSRTIPKDLSIVQTIRRILKGYQTFGFNVKPTNLPELHENEGNALNRHTRTRTLPLLDILATRELNEMFTKRRPKQSLTSSKAQESRRRNPETRMKLNSSSTQKSVSIDCVPGDGNNEEVSSSRPPSGYKRAKLNESGKTKLKFKSSSTELPTSPIKLVIRNSIATLDNLAEVKREMDRNNKDMLKIVEQYKENYNRVEAQLLDKWARVEMFSKAEDAKKEPPFLIYGPSQIELEILLQHGVIATNSLKEKIKKYNVTLTTRTMRYLTSSRRWINQRFKLNSKLKCVYYTRDPTMIIPDFNDVPYIVLATHIAYGCISSEETFDIIHKTWYISRKMVSFIIDLCNKCHRVEDIG